MSDIHIDPEKKGTFKAQASRMGMSTQAAANHILAHKENYSPAMVKKAVFAKNFAHRHDDGGTLLRRFDGGGNGKYIVVDANGEDEGIADWYQSYMNNPLYPAPIFDAPIKSYSQMIDPYWKAPKEVYQYTPIVVYPQKTADPVIDPASYKLRQRYAESSFNDKLESSAGAIGRYQITPITLKEYVEMTGKTGDLWDPVYNEGIRDWYINTRIPQFEAMKRGNPSDLVREYRRYAAYNMGPGALNNALTRAVNDGVDIDNTTDWVKYLPKETRDYVDFIVGGKDIADSTRTAKDYYAALRANGLMSNGGFIRSPFNNQGGNRSSDAIVRGYGNGGGLRAIRLFEDGTPGNLLYTYPGNYVWGQGIGNVVNKVVDAVKGEKSYSDIVPKELPGQAKSDESIKLQDVLRGAGYDIGDDKSDGYFQTKSIKGLQAMLVDAGYDLGMTGVNRDGVDGVVGDKTRLAYSDWVKNGARIKKRNGKAESPAVVPMDNTKKDPALGSSVYTPIKREDGDSEKKYEGIYNYGQYYDDRFSDYVTNTGLDLSNISTEGVADNKHVDAISPYIFKSMDECRTESARNTLECASHITYLNLDNKRGFNIDSNGLRGSAWTMGDNMVKAGGERLFDIFATNNAPSGKWSDGHKQQTIDYVRSMAKDPEYIKYLSTNLAPGDVVELLYPGSNNFKRAYEESKGKHQNTHIGYVVSINGELYIRDNVGNHSTGKQTVHTRKLSSVLSGKERDGVLITGAIRAKDAVSGNGAASVGIRQGRDMSGFGITPTGVDDASQARISNDASYRAMGAVYKNKEKLLGDNNLSVDEFNRIAGLTQAIMFKESASGELFNNQKWISKNSQLPQVVNDTNRVELNKANAFGYKVGLPIAYAFSDLTGGATSAVNPHAEPSAGLGSVKYQGPESSLTDKQRAQLGDSEMIKRALRSSQPEVSGVTTFYALCTSLHKVKKLLSNYAPSDIARNPDIIDQLTALAHNQGLDKIEETLINAKKDGDWEGHMKGLLDATYGRNAMTVRSYNATNMFTDKERATVEAKEKERLDTLKETLIKRGITAEDLANMMAQRESTSTRRMIALAGKER